MSVVNCSFYCFLVCCDVMRRNLVLRFFFFSPVPLALTGAAARRGAESSEDQDGGHRGDHQASRRGQSGGQKSRGTGGLIEKQEKMVVFLTCESNAGFYVTFSTLALVNALSTLALVNPLCGYTCLSVCAPVCLSVCMSVCLAVCLSACLLQPQP